MNMKIYLGLLVLALITVACNRNRLTVDVSKINVSIELNRFDRVMFDTKPAEVRLELTDLYPIHGEFIDLYTERIIKIGPLNGDNFDDYLDAFINDTVIRKVADTVAVTFANFDGIINGIEKGFQHYQYYFPNKTVPRIYTYISGFNESLIVADSLIGVSLDKYLGHDCIFYQYLGIPKYKIENMVPSKIVPDLFYAWALTEFPMSDSVNNLLANMIYQGKLIYYTEAMKPNLPDSLLIGYSGQKLKWCIQNEASMWAYLVEKRLIYSVERFDLQKFIGDSPYTNEFSENSPGRTGIWLGWQIVRSFMQNHSEISLAQLMEIDDAQRILAQSKYYPD